MNSSILRLSFIGLSLSILLPHAAGERPFIFGINRVGGDGAIYNPPDYLEHMYRRLQEIGGTAVRLAASPRDIERVRGVRDWTAFDKDLELALKYGMEPMICIVNTPAWASPTGEDTHLYPYKDELLPEFTDFCEELARRTLGKARIFQIWNEQNGCSWHFHDGFNHADEYTPVLRAARIGLKAGNPDCLVFLGGLDDAEGNAPIFLNLMYEEMPKQFPGERLFDGITTHPYHWNTETLKEKIEALREILKKNGDGHLPVWITEYGWHTREVPLESQARLVSQFLDAFQEWDFLEGAIMLALADFEGGPYGFGVCDANLRPRPSFFAFQGHPRFGASPPYRIEMKPAGLGALEIRWNTILPSLCVLEVEGREELRSTPSGTDHRLTLLGDPGSEMTFRIASLGKESNGNGKKIVSAPYTVRFPADGLFNGDFSEGFFAGIARGWTINGQGFCADGASVPGVGLEEGRHAQAIFSIGREGQRLDSVMHTALVSAPGRRHRMGIRWKAVPGSESTRVLARAGIDVTGTDDPKAASVVWSSWIEVPGEWSEANVEAVSKAQTVSLFIECKTEGEPGKPVFVVERVSVE